MCPDLYSCPVTGSTATVHPSDRAKKLLVKGVPGELRAALIKRAERDGSNLNDTAVAILARAFGVTYKGGSGRRSAKGRITANATSLVLEMPERLHYKISDQALKRRTDRQRLVIQTLSEALRVKRRAA